MATVEDIKHKLHAAAAAPVDEARSLIAEALVLLEHIPEPLTMMAELARHQDKRRGARVRAKLDAAHGIRGRIERHAAAFPDQPTTWRDGYIRGLEDAHSHVQSLSDHDVDDGG